MVHIKIYKTITVFNGVITLFQIAAAIVLNLLSEPGRQQGNNPMHQVAF